MITRLSKFVAKWLLDMGAISQQDMELYEYAVYSLFFNLIPVGIAVVLGLLLHMVCEGILLVLPFILIRKFSGGYHLKSPGTCFIASTTFLLLSMLSIQCIMRGNHFVSFTVVVIFAVLLIFALSPIDSDARKLTENKTKAFRKMARRISGIVFIVFLILLTMKAYRFAVPIGTGIVITAILQLPCIFQERDRNQLEVSSKN